MKYEKTSLKSSRYRALKLLELETTSEPWHQQDLRGSHGIFRYYRFNHDDSFPIALPLVYEINQITYDDTGIVVRNTLMASATVIQGVTNEGNACDLETIFTIDKVGKNIWVSQRANVGRSDDETVHPELLGMYSLYDIQNQNTETQWQSLERTLTE